MKVSRHGFSRGQQRSIPEQAIELVFENGEASTKPGGAVELRMTCAVCEALVAERKREIAVIERAKGVSVIAQAGNILTVYRPGKERRDQRFWRHSRPHSGARRHRKWRGHASALCLEDAATRGGNEGLRFSEAAEDTEEERT